MNEPHLTPDTLPHEVLPGGKSIDGAPGAGAEMRIHVDVGTVVVVRAEPGEPLTEPGGPRGRPGAGFRLERNEAAGELVVRPVSWSSDAANQREETELRAELARLVREAMASGAELGPDWHQRAKAVMMIVNIRPTTAEA